VWTCTFPVTLYIGTQRYVLLVQVDGVIDQIVPAVREHIGKLLHNNCQNVTCSSGT
jgi:hypothetical protein